MKKLITIGLAGVLTCGLAGSAVADGNFHHGGFGHGGKTDFGRQVEELMNAQSEKLFGVQQPLAEDAAAETLPRAGGQQPAGLPRRLRIHDNAMGISRREAGQHG